MTRPDVVSTVIALRERVAAYRAAGERVALVPTMGALHEGHLALARHGRALADRVVVSIFVNPKQFGAGEDFASYPRAGERDRALLAGLADLVYGPTPDVMYPPGFVTAVAVAGPGLGLEGEARPGHFDGVATVVAKLLTQVAPDAAIFGEKDWQQLQVVRRLVRDLDLPVEIVGHPTVRDQAGLALSSRNAYLSPGELEIARRLNGILLQVAQDIAQDIAHAIAQGRAGTGRAEALRRGREAILAAGFAGIDYLEAVDAETVQPGPFSEANRPLRLVAAVRVGSVRLLDNVPAGLSASPGR